MFSLRGHVEAEMQFTVVLRVFVSGFLVYPSGFFCFINKKSEKVASRVSCQLFLSVLTLNIFPLLCLHASGIAFHV